MPSLIAAVIGGSVVAGAGAIAGGAMGASGARDAGRVQADSANRAADIQRAMYDQTRTDLAPFRAMGPAGMQMLQRLLPGFRAPTASAGVTPGTAGAPPTPTPAYQMTGVDENGQPIYMATEAGVQAPENPLVPAGPEAPIEMDPLVGQLESMIPGSKTPSGALSGVHQLLGLNPDGTMPAGGLNSSQIQKFLQSTPGYAFTLDQGLKATQNGYAAKGLGRSGAAMKGAAQFASGLAGQTYEQRLQDYLGTYGTEFTNTYNAYGQRLNAAQNIVSTGENASAQTGQIGVQAGANIGNNVTSAGAATAAGIVGGNNALISGINGLTSSISQGAMLAGMRGAGMFGSGAAGSTSSPSVLNPFSLMNDPGWGPG